MISRRTSGFRKTFDELPSEVQSQARKAFSQFELDPHRRSLKLKQVHPSLPVFSVRVSRGYRAVAYRREDRWVWFWIGPHSAYEKLLDRL